MEKKKFVAHTLAGIPFGSAFVNLWEPQGRILKFQIKK